jgi:hypothetical protein
MERILDWKTVASIHGTIGGVSVKNGLVNSLLCNTGTNQRYPNKIINENEIIYYVGQNTQKYGIKALFASLDEKNSFPVFEKLGVDMWKKVGNFRVNSFEEEKDYYAFKLISL